MPPVLDTILVVVVTAAALVYLIVRKVRSLRRITRAWDSGHAETCHHCPAIQIKHAQLKKLSVKK